MPRIEFEDFNDEEVAHVYLAARLAEAQLVEAELNKQSVDYAVEVESYLAGAVFWVSEYRGAGSTCTQIRQTLVVEFCGRRV